MSSNRGRSRMARGLAIIVLVWQGATSWARGEDPTLPYGRWAVESRGFGWPCRLEALEVRESGIAGELIILGHEAGDEGRLRLWGSSKVGRKASGPPMSGWFTASWISGLTTVRIQLRPEASGKLLGVVRERPGGRGEAEVVRQVILAPVPGEEGPIPASSRRTSGVAARFDRDGIDPARTASSGVFVANSDGTGERSLAPPDGFATASDPCWSPDGRWIAFAGFDSNGRDPLIRVAPAEGGPSTTVAAGTTPTWSSDGSRIAYVASGRADYATDWSSLGRNDERIEAVTLSGPGAGSVEVLARGIWPRWSPIDGRLAFVGRAEANWDIYLRSADGLGVVRLTDDPALDTQPTWASDGRSIVFLSDRGNRWDLYRVRPEVGTRPDRLTDHSRREDHPSLSPDGRHVAFVDARGPLGGSIQILDLGRGTVRPFPERSDGDRGPAWSPDGRSIAFISRRPASSFPAAGVRP